MSQKSHHAMSCPSGSLSDEASLAAGALSSAAGVLIRRKRCSLGLTRSRLARLLGVERSTLCRWEDGGASRCRPSNRRLVAAFLQGRYDQCLEPKEHVDAAQEESKEPLLPTSWTTLPPDILARLERAMNIYRICCSHPDLQAGFVEGLDALMGGTLRAALERSREEAMRAL